MGFFDAIKRWRLANKGMSSGKKRRTTTTSENAVVGSMQRSVWMKLLIYPIFALLVCLIVAFYRSDQTVFQDSGLRRGLLSLIVTAGLILIYHTRHALNYANDRVALVFGGIAVHLALVRLSIHIVDANDWSSDYIILLPPLAFAPMVASVLCGRHAGVFSALSASLLGALMVPEADVFCYVVTGMISGTMAVILTRTVRRRGSLLRAGFYVGITTLLLAFIFKKIDFSGAMTGEGIPILIGQSLLPVSVGLLTGMLVSGLLPALESLFAITTNISWLELSDLNHKLLRKLQLEAPGTYHHSMVVAGLAESAAEEVGANAAMCRVCSYFHDIGKLSKPEYFIENQGDRNPHDALTPTMSAIVIVAHVKDGVDMAIKHKLNHKIIEVIREHHGDSLVQYFYHKAIEQRDEMVKKVKEGLENKEDIPEVDRKNFRYPGPCPSSRESAIISLADAVESASRSLTKPTPEKIRNLVNEVVMSRVADGQLDNSDLAMSDIKKICKSFAATIRSMMHTRIKYPKEDSPQDQKKKHSAVHPGTASSEVAVAEKAKS
ncbi:MAG: HD family phosphohydrolase [Akkermansiaceae bacterium]